MTLGKRLILKKTDRTSSHEKLSRSLHRFSTMNSILLSFKEGHFISINRVESSTISEFLSNCGGLLGLFMGISVLSMVELVYYFTLRLYFKLRGQQTDPSVEEVWVRRISIPVSVDNITPLDINHIDKQSIQIENLSIQSVEDLV